MDFIFQIFGLTFKIRESKIETAYRRTESKERDSLLSLHYFSLLYCVLRLQKSAQKAERQFGKFFGN